MNEPREKAFDVVRTKDPQTEIIIGARTDAIEDEDLTDGARVLFVLLLDMSLDPQRNQGHRGEVIISVTKLSERLCRSKRAIYGWKKELTEKRFVWITKVPRPNMYPLHKFHITALQPRQELREEVPGDGHWGNGYRRPDQVMPLGARAKGLCTKGPSGPVFVDVFGKPISSILLEKSPATGTERPLPSASSAGGSGKTCFSHPQVLPLSSERNDTSHPQVFRVTAAKLAGDDCTERHPLGETQVEKERDLDKGKATAPPESASGPTFKLWQPRPGAFPRELEKLKHDFKAKLKTARTDAARAEYERRLAAVDEALYGPAVPDEPSSPVREQQSGKRNLQRMPLDHAKKLFQQHKAAAGL